MYYFSDDLGSGDIRDMFDRFQREDTDKPTDLDQELFAWIMENCPPSPQKSRDGGVGLHFDLPPEAINYVNARLAGEDPEPPIIRG